MQDYLIGGSDYLARFKNFKLVGRDKEMDMLASVMVRKRSNSIIMVGPAGVGATAICLGLQAQKDDPLAPFDVVSKRFFWLDVDTMFASGDSNKIADGFNAAIARLKRTVDAVLVIEDGGDFYEACRSSGTTYFINHLNSVVKNGDMQVIIEVNDKDYAKVISSHSDFKESYTTMDITEPVGDALRLIVGSAVAKLTDYHQIAFNVDAIEAAVELTNKYRVDGGLGVAQPLRAINLLDRTVASYRLAAHKNPPHLVELQAKGDTIGYQQALAVHLDQQARLRAFRKTRADGENAINSMNEQIEVAISKQAERSKNDIDPVFGGSSYDTPEVTNIRKRIEIIEGEVKKAVAGFNELANFINQSLMVTRKEILGEFSRITGISANKLGEDEIVILRNLQDNLKRHVYGQDHVLNVLSNTIKVSKVGRRNKQRPQGSFMFAGPSGTGKTYVAKILAQYLQGDSKALLRFDMSEYMERHAVSKLIGAPPGYEGFEAGGILTNAMRENRNRIILFDEIEKAHDDIFKLFLQILDDGRLTDNVGRVVDFSESIIIMTTNIGQVHLLDKDLAFSDAVELTNQDLESRYLPEFLNRFNGRQNIICFNRLSVDDVERIVNTEIKDLIGAYEQSGVFVKINDGAIRKFCEEKYDVKTGARGPVGIIVSTLEPIVTNFVLDGGQGDVVFDYVGGDFIIST